ncbi:MAG: hypothetical protein JXB25_00265, partial [Deltaproteobacteria bacterium]|nr:hypothetical protein [Deltaproteobacteria bacterium]
ELSLGNRLRLLSNKICLAARGFTTIPQILSPFPVRVSPPAAAGQPQRSPLDGLFDRENHSCSPLDGRPCP